MNTYCFIKNKLTIRIINLFFIKSSVTNYIATIFYHKTVIRFCPKANTDLPHL